MKLDQRTEFNTRQHMLGEDYEIYYYNDSKNLTVKPHKHNYYEFYFFLQGNVSYEIGKERTPMTYGTIAMVPPGVTHRAVIHNFDIPYRRFVFWVSDEYLHDFAEMCPSFQFTLNLLDSHKGPYIYPLDYVTFNDFLHYLITLLEEVNGSDYGKDDFIVLRVIDLLLHIGKMVYKNQNPATVKQERDLIEQMSYYIINHLGEELTLETLANQFYLSKYHVAHTFKDHVGISLHQFITKRRLAACKDAILMGGKISEVYSQYGFSDYTSFFRAFKKEYGMSPREFRDLSASAATYQDS